MPGGEPGDREERGQRSVQRSVSPHKVTPVLRPALGLLHLHTDLHSDLASDCYKKKVTSNI